MCGIAGWFDNSNQIKNKEDVKRKMLDSLERRGPDAEGIYDSVDKKVTLLHRRLSIIDLENGKQPMSQIFNENTYTIVYNGQLYNAKELREILQDNGFSFKGYSDTEVLLKEGVFTLNQLLPYLWKK